MMLRFCESIPKGWTWGKLGTIADVNPTPTKPPMTGHVTFISMADVSESGQVIGGKTISFQSLKSGFPQFENNDVLIAKITPCFENGKGAYLRQLEGGIGFGSTEFIVLRAKDHVESEFLFIHSKTPEFRIKGRANMAGSAGQQRIQSSFLRDWTIPVPPLWEQRQITKILSTWDQSLELSLKYKLSISRVYEGCSRKFIFPHSGKSFRLSQLFEPQRTQAFKPEGPFKALSVRSHGKGTYQRIEKLEALDSGKTVYRVLANRLIVNIVFAWEGAAAITSNLDTDCLVSHRFPMFRLNDDLIDIEYCRHLIRTSTFKQLLALASPGGAGRNKTLNKTDLLGFELCLPPLEIQKQAGQVLNDLDKQMAAVQVQIEALARQRDALATELLSGRLRVPVAPDLEQSAK